MIENLTKEEMLNILDELNLTPQLATPNTLESCKDSNCKKCSEQKNNDLCKECGKENKNCKCEFPKNKCRKEGVIKLLLTDDCCSDFRLEGGEFVIKDCKDKIVDRLCTDECGEATSKSLCFGEYTIEQVKAPRGYRPIEKRIEVLLEEAVLRVCVKNKKNPRQIKGRFKINKVDVCCKNIRLGGAEFEVFDCEGKKVDCIKTEFGKLAFSKELPLGTYTVVETKAPYGYEKCDEKQTVEIDSPIHIKTLTFENKARNESKGFLAVNAFDKKCPCCGLCGAEFKILSKCGKKVDEICTDEFGLATSKLLPFGEYEIVNTKAPKGYKLLEKPICAKIECEDFVSLYEAPFCREKKDDHCNCRI